MRNNKCIVLKNVVKTTDIFFVTVIPKMFNFPDMT